MQRMTYIYTHIYAYIHRKKLSDSLLIRFQAVIVKKSLLECISSSAYHIRREKTTQST